MTFNGYVVQYIIACSMGLYKPILVALFVLPSSKSFAPVWKALISYMLFTQCCSFTLPNSSGAGMDGTSLCGLCFSLVRVDLP